MLQITHFCDVKFLPRKSESVNSLTNIMSVRKVKGTLLDQCLNQEYPIREMINFCKGVRPCTSYWLIIIQLLEWEATFTCK